MKSAMIKCSAFILCLIAIEQPALAQTQHDMAIKSAICNSVEVHVDAIQSGNETGDQRIEQIDAWLTGWSQQSRFSGVALVADGGEIIYQRAVGLADHKKNLQNTIDGRFDVGSVAKPFLATVVLRLAEEEILDLHKPISEYVVEMKAGPAAEVTIHQLLTHSAGMIDHSDVEGYFDRITKPVNRKQLLAMFKDRPLVFPAGSQYLYSNFGYSAVALAAERATGVTYDRLLDQYVFEPAGMKDSSWNDIDAVIERRVSGYLVDLAGEIKDAPRMYYQADLGSGDILTTARDLWQFDRALSAKLLSEKSLTTMFQPHSHNSSRNRDCGYAWEIIAAHDENNKPIRVYSHAGLALGFVSVIERIPSRNAFFALISNVRPTDDVVNNIPPPDIRRMQIELRQLLFGKRVSPPNSCLARLFLEKHRKNGFEAAFRETRQLYSDRAGDFDFDSEAFMLASYYLAEKEQPDKVIQFIEYALSEARDKSWTLFEALGDFRAEAGDKKKALEAYERALEKMPDRQYLKDRVKELRDSKNPAEATNGDKK